MTDGTSRWFILDNAAVVELRPDQSMRLYRVDGKFQPFADFVELAEEGVEVPVDQARAFLHSFGRVKPNDDHLVSQAAIAKYNPNWSDQERDYFGQWAAQGEIGGTAPVFDTHGSAGYGARDSGGGATAVLDKPATEQKPAEPVHRPRTTYEDVTSSKEAQAVAQRLGIGVFAAYDRPGHGAYNNANASTFVPQQPTHEQLQALADFEKNFPAGVDHEVAQVWGLDGKPMLNAEEHGGKKGGKQSVGFSPEEIDTFRAEAGAILTHNHPNDSSLSDADFRMASYSNLGAIRATTKDYVYSVGPKPGHGWPSMSAIDIAAGDAEAAMLKGTDYGVVFHGSVMAWGKLNLGLTDTIENTDVVYHKWWDEKNRRMSEILNLDWKKEPRKR